MLQKKNLPSYHSMVGLGFRVNYNFYSLAKFSRYQKAGSIWSCNEENLF